MRFDDYTVEHFNLHRLVTSYEAIQRGVREESAKLNETKGPLKTKLFRDPKAVQATSSTPVTEAADTTERTNRPSL
ncbi:MAG: hypothetical protein AB7I18_08180 [Candidatus Berkiella sp.]